MPAWLIPLLKEAAPYAAQFLGSQIERAQSRGDIARQNAYNSPTQQIARLREAGLPNAALLNGGPSTGNQTSLPSTNKSLSNYITSQTQLKQLDILKAEIRLKNAQADEADARRDWLLNGYGETIKPTNLTEGLQTGLGIQKGQQVAQGFANAISEATAKNTPYKLSLENQEQEQRIMNAIQSYSTESIKQEGYKLDNAIKEIEKRWTPSMNAAKLNGILLENGIKVQEQGLKAIQLEIENATKSNIITMSNVNTALAKLGLQQFGTNYEYNKEYQAIASRARQLAKGGMGIREYLDSVGAWIFTTLSDITGGGKIPNMSLPNLGDNSRTFNTNNYINQK